MGTANPYKKSEGSEHKHIIPTDEAALSPESYKRDAWQWAQLCPLVTWWLVHGFDSLTTPEWISRASVQLCIPAIDSLTTLICLSSKSSISSEVQKLDAWIKLAS